MKYAEEAVSIEAICEEIPQKSVAHRFVGRWRKQCIVCRTAFGFAVYISVDGEMDVHPYWDDHGSLRFQKAASGDGQHPSIFHLFLVIR